MEKEEVIPSSMGRREGNDGFDSGRTGAEQPSRYRDHRVASRSWSWFPVTPCLSAGETDGMSDLSGDPEDRCGRGRGETLPLTRRRRQLILNVAFNTNPIKGHTKGTVSSKWALPKSGLLQSGPEDASHSPSDLHSCAVATRASRPHCRRAASDAFSGRSHTRASRRIHSDAAQSGSIRSHVRPQGGGAVEPD